MDDKELINNNSNDKNSYDVIKEGEFKHKGSKFKFKNILIILGVAGFVFSAGYLMGTSNKKYSKSVHMEIQEELEEFTYSIEEDFED